jgi:GMP synthase (glutamine-hydrolysing)
MFLILDFGSQYTHLIKFVLSKLGYESHILAGDYRVVEFYNKLNKNKNLEGLILSGGASSVYDGKIDFDKKWLNLGIPILGICYGHQLLADRIGGKVGAGKAEFGKSVLELKCSDGIFKDLPKKFVVWMSHRDSVKKLPKGFSIIASSDYSKVAAIKDDKKLFYGVQFHPEVSHTENGSKILDNFCSVICRAKRGKRWTAKNFIDSIVGDLRQEVGSEKIIFGLSGGVDSLTMSVLLRKAFPKKQIKAVYVDTGLMPDETLVEVKSFCKNFDIPLKILDAKEVFFKSLKGIEDPTEKGMIIGKRFIEVFEGYAKSFGARYFAQGTIWSDVVESGVTKFSSRIKPHHNVAALPKKFKFKLLEPLRELFKNQVREISKELGLPDWVVKRKVFPGPGFAIRVQGEVTPSKVELVKKATKIVEDIIYQSEIKDKIWMAFAILINVPSLGVKGDDHVKNEQAVVVRIVESDNSMTANFSRIAMPYLPEISKRIVDELNIGRVVYDITDKPPATIEWQ